MRHGKIAVAERTVSRDDDLMLFAPWDDRVFDSALLQMIQKLVADNMAIADHTMGVFQVSDIEIAHAPKTDLSGRCG
jgi:hypothetical protein